VATLAALLRVTPATLQVAELLPPEQADLETDADLAMNRVLGWDVKLIVACRPFAWVCALGWFAATAGATPVIANATATGPTTANNRRLRVPALRDVRGTLRQSAITDGPLSIP
jgi:hypothetical protein